jgi:hypothetical protein
MEDPASQPLLFKRTTVREAGGHQPARASAAPCILAEKVLKEVLRYAQAGHMGLIASAARLLFPEDAILECEE